MASDAQSLPKEPPSKPAFPKPEPQPAITDAQAEVVKLTGQVEALQKALVEEQQKAEKYLNELKYLRADFDNYQKRLRREFDGLAELSNQRLVAKLLGTLDELELAIAAAQKASGTEAWVAGFEMVLRKLREVLRQEGLSAIEAVGKPFDPGLHEAAVKVPSETAPEGTVVEEIRRGYTFKGKVIRPAVVKVASAPPSGKGAPSQTEGEAE
ncbi:MAG: nucleotide exchange factor GrpE [Candidatus Bathyarchaeia archaeon]